LTSAGAAFTGTGTGTGLLTSASSNLPLLASAEITYTVKVTPGALVSPVTPTTFNNTAVASGTGSSGGNTTDNSTDGTNPDVGGNGGVPARDNDGDPTNNTSPTPVSFAEAPALTVAKAVGAVINSGDGSYLVPYTVTVTNTGDIRLNSVQVTDDLAAIFVSPATFTVVSAGTSVTVTGGGTVSGNAAFNGGTNKNLLTTGTLDVGANAQIQFIVKVTPGSDLGPYSNAVTATGISPAGQTKTANSSVLVTFTEAPALTVTKSAGVITRVAGQPNQYDIPFTVTVKNTGDVLVKNIQVTDNLNTAFTGAGYAVQSGITVTGGTGVAANTGFNGGADQNLLTAAANSLTVNSTISITFTVRVTVTGALGPFTNAVTGSGTSPAGVPVTDTTSTAVSLTSRPLIGVAKRATANVNNNDGTYSVTYVVRVQNYGNVALSNVQVTDNLSATFAGATFTIQSAPAIGSVVNGAALTSAGAAFTGTGAGTNLLAAASSNLPLLASAEITYTVRVTPGALVSPVTPTTFNNTAVASGTGSSGGNTTDNSIDGTNPDPDGDVDPNNNTSPTPVSFAEAPAITISKTAGLVTNNNDGSFSVPYTVAITNTGDVELRNLRVTDDLAAVILSPATFIIQTAPAFSTSTGTTGISPNPAFSGSADKNLVLANTNRIDSGGTFTLTYTVRITTNGALPAYRNTANVTSSSPGTQTKTGTSSSTLIIPPTLAKTFVPASISTGGTTTLTFTINNPNASTTLNGLAFSDTLPLNLQVANPPGVVGNCNGGTVTAAAGATTIGFANGTLTGGASCAISVQILVPIGGTYNNTTGAITSTDGGRGNTAQATVVTIGAPLLTKAFAPTNVPAGGTSKLTITITNTSSTDTLLGVRFNDPFPAGLIVASPPNLTNTCGGATTGGVAGGTSVGLNSGTILASGSCTITVDVTSVTASTYNNITTPVGSDNGGTGTSGSGTVVFNAPPSLAKSFSPNPIPVNGISTLTLVLTNPNPGTALVNVSFSDTFPVNTFVVATPPSLNNGCGGTVTGGAVGGTSIGISGVTLAGSASCTLTVAVTSSQAGSFTNVINSVTSDNGGTGAGSSATLNVASGLTIQKAFNPTTIQPNQPSVLTFTLTNPTTGALTGIAFSDMFPTGLVVAAAPNLSSTCGGTLTGGTAGATAFSLANGTLSASQSCTITVNVTAATGGTYPNVTGTVTSNESGPQNTASATLMVPVALTITKAFDSNPIPVNGTSVMRIRITNPNKTLAQSGVAFSDMFPAGLVVAAAPALVNSCGGAITGGTAGATSVALAGGSLTAGASCEVSLTVTASTANTYPNTTGAVSSTEGGTGNTASASLTTQSGLTFSKAFSPTQLAVGQTSVLTFTVSNPTNTLQTGLNFTDTFPGGLVVAPAPGVINTCGGNITGAAAGGNTIGLTAGTLNAQAICTISVNVVSATANTYDNQTSAIASNETPSGNQATATVTYVSGLSIAKAFNPILIKVNEISSLTFTLTNGSMNALTGVAFNDTLPSGLTFSAVPTVVNTCGGSISGAAPNGAAIALTGGSLASSANCTVSVNVTGASGGSFTNISGVVSSNETGAGNTATALLTVKAPDAPALGVADPVIVKRIDPALALPGENVNYTITVTNTGNAPAVAVIVTDPVPNPLTVVSATASRGTFTITGQNVVFNVGSVNPGDVITLTVTARVRPDAPTPLDVINVATLTWPGGTRTSSATSGSATLRITRGQLPRTGEHPEQEGSSSAPILLLGFGVVLTVAASRKLRRAVA